MWISLHIMPVARKDMGNPCMGLHLISLSFWSIPQKLLLVQIYVHLRAQRLSRICASTILHGTGELCGARIHWLGQSEWPVASWFLYIEQPIRLTQIAGQAPAAAIGEAQAVRSILPLAFQVRAAAEQVSVLRSLSHISQAAYSGASA